MKSTVAQALTEYVLNNIRSLTGFHWLLILLFSLLFGTCLFFLMRWIYREVIAAQGSVISLKDNTIQSYRDQTSLLETQAQQLQAGIGRYSSALNALANHSRLLEDRRAALESLARHSVKNVFVLRAAVVRLEQVRSVLNYLRLLHGLLVIYEGARIGAQVSGAPSTIALYDRLEQVERDVARLGPLLPDLVPQDNDLSHEAQVPQQLLEFPYDTIIASLESIHAEMKKYADAYFYSKRSDS